MAAPALNLDLSAIAIGSPRVPDPIANALATVQTTVNSLGNIHIATDANIAISKTDFLSSTSYGNTLLGISDVSANQTTITTIVDLTSLSVTVTVPAGGRRIRIRGVASFANTSGAGAVFYIFEGAGQLQSARVNCPDPGLDYTSVVEFTAAATAGSHTYKLRAMADTGTVTMVASATHPAFITVEII